MNSYADLEREYAAIRRRERRREARWRQLLWYAAVGAAAILLWIGLFTLLAWLSGAMMDKPAEYKVTGIDRQATDINAGSPAWVLEGEK